MNQWLVVNVQDGDRVVRLEMDHGEVVELAASLYREPWPPPPPRARQARRDGREGIPLVGIAAD